MIVDPRTFTLLWARQARDVIALHKGYVRITGDIGAGAALSQILYWFDEDGEGRVRARVERDGFLWIAKSAEALARELGLLDERGRPRAKIARRYIDNLRDLGLIVTEVRRFDGTPMFHIRPVWDAIAGRVSRFAQLGISGEGKSEAGNSPNGNLDFPTEGKSITEITSDTTNSNPLPDLSGGDGSLLDGQDGPPPPADAGSAGSIAESGKRIRAEFAAWCGFQTGSLSPKSYEELRSWVVAYLGGGGTVEAVKMARARWGREHHAGRDHSRTEADRRPASIRQAADWVSRCAATEPTALFASDALDAETDHRPVEKDGEGEGPWSAAWRGAMGDLRLTLAPATFEAWFKDMELVKIERGPGGATAVVTVPSVATAQWLADRASGKILDALQQHIPTVTVVTVVHRNSAGGAERRVA